VEMEELVVERLKCHNPSVDPTKIFLAPRCSKRGRPVTVPDIILHLHRDNGKLLVEGDSRSISHLLLKMGITWSSELQACKCYEDEEHTEEWIRENLIRLAKLAGFKFTSAWSADAALSLRLAYHYVTGSYYPSPSELELALSRASLNTQNLVRDMRDMYELQEEERRYMSQYIGTSCRPEIFIPRSIFYDQEHHDEHCDTERMIGRYEIVPMLQALRAFREMGATPGDLDKEMRLLLTDDAYWHEWCGTDWIV
jgi:hypothetical protein